MQLYEEFTDQKRMTSLDRRWREGQKTTGKLKQKAELDLEQYLRSMTDRK